jgi:hypothetical protein
MMKSLFKWFVWLEFNTVLLGYSFLELFVGTVPNDIPTEALTFIIDGQKYWYSVILLLVGGLHSKS